MWYIVGSLSQDGTFVFRCAAVTVGVRGKEAGVDGRELRTAVRVVGVVEGLAVLRQVRERALGQVVVGLLLVVDDVGRVVGDDVEEDLHALGVRLGDEGLKVLVGAEVRVDLGEVGDPVAVVALPRRCSRSPARAGS